MTNILISGLGGVGGYYGAKLALAYADSKDVSIFDKPTRVVIETEAGMFLVLLREAIAVAQANGIDVLEEICRQVLDRFWKNDLFRQSQLILNSTAPMWRCGVCAKNTCRC